MPPGGPNARHGVTLTVCLLRARPTRAVVYPSGHGPGRHPPAPRRCKSRPGFPAAQPMAKPRGHQSIYFVPPDVGLPVCLRRRPSSPLTSGSALRLANSSASHPHLLQSCTPASVVHGLTLPSIHGSFDPVLIAIPPGYRSRISPARACGCADTPLSASPWTLHPPRRAARRVGMKSLPCTGSRGPAHPSP